MLELLILLISDISPYRDTFDMIHRYTWSLYRPISSGHILKNNINSYIINVIIKVKFTCINCVLYVSGLSVFDEGHLWI